MKQLIITVEDDEQVQTVLNTLQEAEEEGVIGFPFNTQLSDEYIIPKKEG